MSNATVTYDVYHAKSYDDALKIMAGDAKNRLSQGASLHPSHHVTLNAEKFVPECRVSREFKEKLAETVLLLHAIIAYSQAEDLEKGAVYGNDDE